MNDTTDNSYRLNNRVNIFFSVVSFWYIILTNVHTLEATRPLSRPLVIIIIAKLTHEVTNEAPHAIAFLLAIMCNDVAWYAFC